MKLGARETADLKGSDCIDPLEEQIQMKSSNVLRQLVSIFPTLRKDEDGHTVLYFTIMLPVIIGMIGLSLDGGAFFHLNTDLHELADAAALAGAKELQGKSGDRGRATTEAKTLLSNDPHWSNVARSGVMIRVRCAENTPAAAASIALRMNTTFLM